MCAPPCLALASQVSYAAAPFHSGISFHSIPGLVLLFTQTSSSFLDSFPVLLDIPLFPFLFFISQRENNVLCPCMSETVFIWYRILSAQLFSLRNLRAIAPLPSSVANSKLPTIT
jgi:hypothetical protein